MTEAGAMPMHRPMACGALGSFDEARLARVVSAVDEPLTEVHRTETAALHLNGRPLPWAGAEGEGVAWAEAYPGFSREPRDWRDAARLGGCGLILGERPRLHSSVSGLGPLHWVEAESGVYFCTRIEPLLAAIDGQLRPDWQAWASILTLGYPTGDETPFEGVRRLPPMATLERGPRGASVTTEAWPWAQVEPVAGDEAPDEIAHALREEIARLPRGALQLPLTGGWDSRLLGCLLAEDGREVRAYTVNADKRNDVEERYAAGVAAALGFEHELVATDPGRFEAETRWTAAAQEHIGRLHLPLARLGLAMGSAPLVEGAGGDIMVKALFAWPQMGEAEGWRAKIDAFLGIFVEDGPGVSIFHTGLWRAMHAGARERLHADTLQFRDAPSGESLAAYWTRTRRYVSLAPFGLLPAAGPVATPFVSDEVVQAALRVPLTAKNEGALYRRLLELVNPQVAALPSTNDPARERDGARAVPRLRKSPQAIAFYERVLAEHPLRDAFSQELREALAGGSLRRFLRGPIRLRLFEQLIVFGLWWERYRERLGDADPRELGR